VCSSRQNPPSALVVIPRARHVSTKPRLARSTSTAPTDSPSCGGTSGSPKPSSDSRSRLLVKSSRASAASTRVSEQPTRQRGTYVSRGGRGHTCVRPSPVTRHAFGRDAPIESPIRTRRPQQPTRRRSRAPLPSGKHRAARAAPLSLP
jgi:hypothetical protein